MVNYDKCQFLYRFILNPKRLNKFITTPRFKLQDIRVTRNLITKDCFLASIDHKDAYFAVAIHDGYKKFLRFVFKNNIYEFQSLPFGLSTAPYLFIKLLRPAAFSFKKQFIISCVP